MADRTRVLIVDDEVGIRNQLRWGLADAFDVRDADGVASARNLLSTWSPDVLLLDVHLEDGSRHSGFDVLSLAVETDPLAKVIMVTGESDPDLASRAIELGAWDYYAKPIDTDELRIVASRAARVRELQRHARSTSNGEASSDDDDFESWLGTGPGARRVARLLQSLAASSEPVLVLGEPGTGREQAVAALHGRPRGANGGFVEIDPTRPLPRPETLPESGTFVVKDVTELSGTAIESLPEWTEAIATRGRAVFCGPADLADRAQGGAFPLRIYHFLAALTVSLPPLRERPEDVPDLARSLLASIAERTGSPTKSLTAAAVKSLQQYLWPGNLRELERRLTGAHFVAESETIGPDDLWPPSVQVDGGLKRNLAALERELVERAVREHQGNVSRAAKSLDVSRPTLHSLLRKHDIDPVPFRVGSGS